MVGNADGQVSTHPDGLIIELFPNAPPGEVGRRETHTNGKVVETIAKAGGGEVKKAGSEIQ